MIRYTLKCSEDHSFESWFKSASAFETLKAAGQLSCPHCGSDQVDKSLMAPPVTTARQSTQNPEKKSDRQAQEATNDTAPAPQKTDTPAPQSKDPAQADQPADLTAMREHVEANSDYVGADFTKEARAMHEGDAPERSIYGEAKLEDAKALIDDGVPIMPLPFRPKRKLN